MISFIDYFFPDILFSISVIYIRNIKNFTMLIFNLIQSWSHIHAKLRNIELFLLICNKNITIVGII